MVENNRKEHKQHSGGARRYVHKRRMFCDVCQTKRRHNKKLECIFCNTDRKRMEVK